MILKSINNPSRPCLRQMFLANKILELSKKDHPERGALNFITVASTTLLRLDFKIEEYFDEYTFQLSYGTAKVPYNETTSQIRLKALSSLINIYYQLRGNKDAYTFLDEILKILFFAARKPSKEYNQIEEVSILFDFLDNLLSENYLQEERSKILKELRLFIIRELKDEYAESIEHYINQFSSVETLKDKLYLLLTNEYFYLRANLEHDFESLLKEYSTWEKFYSDILQVRNELDQQNTQYFYESLALLNKNHKEKSKELLQYILETQPEKAVDFVSLACAHSDDEIYFYDTIDKIWRLDNEYAQSKVIWLITRGRNKTKTYYRQKDFDYIESIINSNNKQGIHTLSFNLHHYLDLDKEKTFAVLKKLLEGKHRNSIIDQLIYNFFEEAETTARYALELKDLLFSTLYKQDLPIYQASSMLSFLENNFNFETVFDYLSKQMKYKKSQNDYYYISSLDRYQNKSTSEETKNENYLYAINKLVGSTAEEQQDYFELAKLFRPLNSIKDNLSALLEKIIETFRGSKDNLYTIARCIQTFEEVSEPMLKRLIQISDTYLELDGSRAQDCFNIFGSDIVNNYGSRSGTSGQPFPQDLAKKALLQKVLKNQEMRPETKIVLEIALKNVEKDIGNSGKDIKQW